MAHAYAPPMPLPTTKSQIVKLGRRLCTGQLREGDEALWAELLDCYQSALEGALARLRECDLHAVGRVKTRSTVIDKLQRDHRISLATMQDLAGARMLIDGTRIDQDRIGERVREIFEPGVLIKDRRLNPSYGYRALHLIVTQDELPIEIQIRTPLQHLWAEITERLADVWGRQIRYGGLPVGAVEQRLWSQIQTLAENADTVEYNQAQVIELTETAERLADPPADLLERLKLTAQRVEETERGIRATMDEVARILRGEEEVQ